MLEKLLYGSLLAVAIGAWFLAYRAPLWLDETVSYWQIAGGFGQIWQRSVSALSFPAYAYILWATRALLGSSEVALRVPSVIAMGAAAYFLYRSAREMFSFDVAMIATLMFCADPRIVFAAIDVRPYALGTLAVTFAMYTLLRWTRTQRLVYAVLFGLSSAFILYSHYLFGIVLPVWMVYYLAVRYRHLREDLTQLAIVLGCFAVAAAPVFPRVVQLFATRSTHVFAETPTLREFLLPLWPVFAAAVATAVWRRRVRWMTPLLCLMAALVPLGFFYGVSTFTSTHIYVDRYCVVAVPGIALCWGLLIRTALTRPLYRQVLAVALLAVFVIPAFWSPQSRFHGYTWKYILEFVNETAASSHMPVLVCSDFPESDFARMPPASETEASVFFAQLSYYKLNTEVIGLPRELNAETTRVAKEFIDSASQKRQSFLAVATVASTPTLRWVSGYSKRLSYNSNPIGESNQIFVVEYTPK